MATSAAETHLPISFSRLRHLCVVDRVVHLSVSVPCLPGTVRCQMQLSGIHWTPLAMTSFFAFAFIGICLCLALFLSARRWRRGALVLACISCISVPIGTILGGLTIYALTRPEVSSEFT